MKRFIVLLALFAFSDLKAQTTGGASAISGSSLANPTASVGLSAVNGSASTALRSDGAPALDQSIAPTWTGAHAFSNQVTLNNASATTGAGKMLKNNADYAVTVDAGTTLSMLEFTKRNLDVTSTGHSEFVGLKITTADSCIDCGEAIQLVNKGRADALHINAAGIVGAPTANQPTGIGIDVNRNGSSENSSTFLGYGLQIYDWSSTNGGVNGAHGIFLRKVNNPNSDHRLFWAQGNNNLVYLFGPGGAGFDATKPIMEYDTTGTAFWKLTAGGDVYQPIGKYGLGTASPQETFSQYGSASTNTWNMTATDKNITTSSHAQATDTSSINLSFTGTAKPQIKIIGITGNTVAVIDSAGLFGLGMTPAVLIDGTDVDGTGTTARLSAYGSAGGATYSGRSAQGTATTPTATISGNGLVALKASGYTGAAFTGTKAQIGIIADSAWDATHNGTRIDFQTTANDGTTLTQRMRINNRGNVSIGSTTMTSLLNIGSAAQFQINSSGQPVLINNVTVPAGEHNYYAVLSDTVSRSAQTATIGATNLNGTATNGVYRVSVYLYPTTAGTSGTVTATIKWNDGAAESAVTGTHTFGALGTPVFINGQICTVTNSTAITWETTVTSPVGSPVYTVNVVAERIW
jgi:hypothetical protein